jgi:phage terminase large subunit
MDIDVKISYKPHKNQKLIHEDSHRYKVVCAGRRFGKSVFARNHCLLNALYDPGLYWIVSPTYRQGKMIHWMDLKKEIPEELVDYKNEQELSIHLINGSRIELKGADNEDALRGVGLKGVVMDEAADQKPHIWFEIIQPMLLDSKGWAVFIGTPKGFNWFYELFLKGQEKSNTFDPEWKSFQFTSYDNPTIPDVKKELDKIKSKSLKDKKEDSFAQEYLAEFRKFSGLIYPEFDRKINVVDAFEIPEDWEIYRGIDFGFDNPTACIWLAISPEGKHYAIDEYYESKQTSDYHCGIIISKSAQYPAARVTYGDPSAPQIHLDWSQKGVYITPARRDPSTNKGEWVGHGIDTVRDLLKVQSVDKLPRFFVFKNCENLIREFETYKWAEQKDEQLNNPGRPEKANDHLMDALRYIEISYLRNPDSWNDQMRYGRDYRNINAGLSSKWSL